MYHRQKLQIAFLLSGRAWLHETTHRCVFSVLFAQVFTLNVSGDMTVQDLLVNVHRQLTGSKHSKIEPSSCYVVHMMPKEFEQKKFIPSDSTSKSNIYSLSYYVYSKFYRILYVYMYTHPCTSMYTHHVHVCTSTVCTYAYR